MADPRKTQRAEQLGEWLLDDLNTVLVTIPALIGQKIGERAPANTGLLSGGFIPFAGRIPRGRLIANPYTRKAKRLNSRVELGYGQLAKFDIRATKPPVTGLVTYILYATARNALGGKKSGPRWVERSIIDTISELAGADFSEFLRQEGLALSTTKKRRKLTQKQKDFAKLARRSQRTLRNFARFGRRFFQGYQSAVRRTNELARRRDRRRGGGGGGDGGGGDG